MAKIEINIPLSDEEGNPLPSISEDAITLMALLEWGRRRGFRFGPSIKIGSIETTVSDLHSKTSKVDDDVDPWKAAGYEG